VELYRPTPPAGTEVPIRLQITRFDLDANIATCDFEIQDGEGGLWMRVRGWRDRVFVKEDKFMEVHRVPERRCFSTRRDLPGLPPDSVCTEMTEGDLSAGSLSWIAALHLTADELKRIQKMIGKRRSQFLLGRIAVKDAVRRWLAEQDGSEEMLHPAAISIGQTESGQPFVEALPGVDRLPKISLSHTDGRTVAVAASEPVGIDVEPASRPTDQILDDFATPQEAEQVRKLAAQQPDQAWPTRLWCAKESASKVLGTGLGGGLRDYQLAGVNPDGDIRIRHEPSARELAVATVRDEDMILACCWDSADRVVRSCPSAGVA
jgi:phosphopantetheinyl transferase